MYKTLISVNDAKNLTGEVVFVDCRHQLTNPAFGQEQYQLGHLPKAQFAHLDHDLSSAIIKGKTGRHPLPHPEKLADFFGRLGIKKSSQVIAYDQDNGMFASRLWWLLRAMGHDAVAVLDGGYAAWIAHGGDIEQHQTANTATVFEGKWQANVVDSADVFARLGDQHRVLIDARMPERFKGLEEPLDHKAGHIPHAVNLPFSLNLQNGYWRNQDELKARFEPFKDQQMVCYCGSGVTACHNILAAVHAGLTEPLLYAGSWSEWINEDKHPIELGI